MKHIPIVRQVLNYLKTAFQPSDQAAALQQFVNDLNATLDRVDNAEKARILDELQATIDGWTASPKRVHRKVR